MPLELIWEANPEKGAEGATGAFVGIDLGTSNSCLALWHPTKHRAKVIKSRLEGRTTPSVVYFHSANHSTIGQQALADAEEGQGVPVTAVKRVIGLNPSDKALEGLEGLPGFKLATGRDGKLMLEAKAADGATVRRYPEEVSSLVMAELRAAAEAYLQRKPFPGLPKHVDRAVVTVPAHFSEPQKDATRRAAAMAGFKHVTLLSEPFAAAMSYGLFVAGTKKVLTFDMGGGTTDVSVLALHEGTFEVLAMNGDNRLGGEEMDQALLDYVLAETRISASSLDRRQLSHLRAACSEAKVVLSAADRATVDVGAALGDGKGGRFVVHRAKFEEPMYLVPITVELNAHGVLRVSVGEPPEPGAPLRDDGPVDPTHVYILAGYCLLLLGLYIFFKVYFSDVRIAWTAPQASSGGETSQGEL